MAASSSRKTRELHNHHFDSTVWNDFVFRNDDIVISTYAKAGTTWTQQIVGQLVFAGDPNVQVANISPWVDLRVPPKPDKLAMLEAQQHRRILKTHLPVDALTMSPQAKYVYVARDGRDVLWSLHNHHSAANDLWYQVINDTPGRVGPPIGKPDPDVRNYFLTWLDQDGHPFWPFWENVRSWWALRGEPNVHIVHFADLKADLPGEARKLAAFLEIEVPQEAWPKILDHCSFAFMKANAERIAPLGGAIFEGGGDSFIHKGVNGRWRDVLKPADVAAYEARAKAELGPECAAWLATGRLAQYA